jgi:hypothetical protein
VSSLSFDQLLDLTHGRYGVTDAPCPVCGPERRSAVNQRRKTLRMWCDAPDRITYHCARCGARGWATNDRSGGAVAEPPEAREKIKADIALREAAHAKTQRIKYSALWRRRLAPSHGTPAHAYLRQARGYGGRIPATIGYLPASRDFPPAMISAIGIARETEPGELVIDDDAIRGVHLTSLKSDGSGKAGTERDKITIGRSLGSARAIRATCRQAALSWAAASSAASPWKRAVEVLSGAVVSS